MGGGVQIWTSFLVLEVGDAYDMLLDRPWLRAVGVVHDCKTNQLTMQGKVEEIAHKILATAKELKLTSGRGPTGIAAAASYIASVLTGERKTQREIAEIAQVTEVTIRNRYKELVERLQFVIYL